MNQERGTILVAMLPLALIAAAFSLLSITSSVSSRRVQDLRRNRATALAHARSALAVAQARIKTADYVDDANSVLATAITEGESTGLTNHVGEEVFVLLITNDAEVWVSKLEGVWYQLDTIASVGSATVHVRSLVRELDSFSRYYAFSDLRSLGVTGIAKGPMHSNQFMHFYGPDTVYTAPVSASLGFTYNYGATEENTTLTAGSNSAAEPVEMPDIGVIEDRAQYNSAAFNAAYTTLDFVNAGTASELHLQCSGDTVDLVKKSTSTGAVEGEVLGIPLPPSGVIYVARDIAGLRGTVRGRLTIVTAGNVLLSGSLQYVDADGDTAYLNGIPQNPATDTYEPNPDYDGNAVLGILAGGNIHYRIDAPDQMEHNAYFFSANGSFGVPDTAYPVKQTLRRLGGVTVRYSNIGAYMSYSNGNTTTVAGFPNRRYDYDSRLRYSPPPHFVSLPRPVFAAFRIVGGTESKLSGTGQTWTEVQSRPIGHRKRNNANGNANGNDNGNANGNGNGAQ